MNHPLRHRILSWAARALLALPLLQTAGFAQEDAATPGEAPAHRQLAPGAESEPEWMTTRLEAMLDNAPLRCIFEDRFANLNFWSLEPGSLWHLQNDSACLSPGSTSAPGALVFNDEAACSYETGQAVAGYAEMNVDVVLPQNVLGAVLTFQDSLEVELAFDTAAVEVSTDGGTTWEATSFVRRRSDRVWGEETVDLSAFIGETIRIRFVFDTIDAQANDFAGWFVDDVRICTTTVPPGYSGVFVDDLVIDEGDFGPTNARLTINVQPPHTQAFGFRYRTLDDSALAGDSDYIETIGTLTFAAGETTKTIDIPIIGDPFQETDEVVLLELHDLTGGGEKIVFANTIAAVTITNDDLPSAIFVEDFEDLDAWTATGEWIAQEDAPCLNPDVERPENNAAYTRQGVLNLTGGDYFTQEFNGDFSLDNTTVRFTPQSTPGPRFYDGCIQPASTFPTDPAGGTALTMFDDDSVEVLLPTGTTVPLYGVSYSKFFIGSNGYINFSNLDYSFDRSLTNHFSQPRIAALLTDIHPSRYGIQGAISYKIISTEGAQNRVAVTYSNVSEYRADNKNSFQIELFFDGRIQITWLDVEATTGVVGLSEGKGVPLDFTRTIFSGLSPCPGAPGSELPPPAVPCGYLPNSTGYLTLNDPVSLPPGTDLFLRWRDFALVEPVNDKYFVEISLDGTFWQRMYEGLDSDPVWNTETLDLSAYSGREIRIRFGFASDDATEDLGWFIDTVRLEAVTLPADYSIVYLSPTSRTEGNGLSGDLTFPEAQVQYPDLRRPDFTALESAPNNRLSPTELEAAATGNLDDSLKAIAVGLRDNFAALDIGNRDLEFRVTVLPPNPRPITLRVTTSDIAPSTDFTATSGTDYPATVKTLEIPANATSIALGIPMRADLATEGDEALKLKIDRPSSNAIISSGEVIGTILNDDAPGRVRIDDIVIQEGNDSTATARFTVTVDPVNSLPIRMNYRTIQGSALESIDFVQQSGVLEIEPGLDRGFIVVQVRGDVFPEPDETFFVELSDPSVTGLLVDRSNAIKPVIRGSATIANDDDATVGWSDDMESTSGLFALGGQWHYQENSTCIAPAVHGGRRALVYNDEGTCTYDPAGGILRGNASLTIPVDALQPRFSWWQYVDQDSDVQMQVQVVGVSAPLTDTAYTVTQDDLSWQRVEIDLSAYAGATVNVQFVVTPTGQPATGGATGWYLDDMEFSYIQAAGVNTLTVSDASVVEGNFGTRDLIFEVRLNAPAAAGAGIDYVASGITATEVSDFIATEGTLTILPGDASAQVTVPVKGDFEIEEVEQVQLLLFNPSNNLFVEKNKAVGSITNDDFEPGTMFGTNGAQDPFRFFKSSITKPALSSSVALPPGNTIAGGDFSGFDHNTFYVLDSANNSLSTINTSTGIPRSNALLTPASGTWAGMAWNLPAGRFDVLSSDNAGNATVHPVLNTTATVEGIQFFFDFLNGRIFDGYTDYPFQLAMPIARTQVIYPAQYLGQPRVLDSLSLRVEVLPGGTVRDFTIRIQHTNASVYTAGNPFTSTGWTTVYSSDEQIKTPGWVTFPLQTPFTYVGGNLLVDFSYRNIAPAPSAAVNAGVNTKFVFIFEEAVPRVLTATAPSGTGNPLAWDSTTGPQPGLQYEFPDLRLGSISVGGGLAIPAGTPDISHVVGMAIHPTTGLIYLASKAATGPGAYISTFDTRTGLVAIRSALNLAGSTNFELQEGDLDFDDATANLYFAAYSNRSGTFQSELFQIPVTSKLDEPTILVDVLGDGTPVTSLGITALPSPPGTGAVYDIGVRTIPGLRIEGVQADTRVPGTATEAAIEWLAGSGVGDVNNDGRDDFIVSVPSTDLPGTPDPQLAMGESYLIFGGNPALSSMGVLSLADFDATLGVRFPGVVVEGNAGYAVSGVGDTNKDGFDDLLIAAPNADFGGLNRRGVVYLVYGSASWPATFNLNSRIADEVIVLIGDGADAETGFSVAGAGDVNGDGAADMLIGAPNYFEPTESHMRGRVYLVFGSQSRPGGLTGELALGTLDGTNGLIFNGTDTYISPNGAYLASNESHAGRSVSGAGDVNGDGYDDIIIGDSNVPDTNRIGAVYLIYGAADLGASTAAVQSPFWLENTVAAGGATFTTGIVGIQSGWNIASAGDVDADGYDDFIVSSHVDIVGATGGYSILVYGNATGLIGHLNLASTTASPKTSWFIGQEGSQSGFGLTGAGDVNGDGFADLLIGAHRSDALGIVDAGEVFLIYGSNSLPSLTSTTSLDKITSQQGLRLHGALPSTFVGRTAALLGDINGDGYSDFLFTAPGADPETVADAGEFYVVFGQPTAMDPLAEYTDFLRSGEQDPPAAGLPNIEVQVGPRNVGVLGDGSHAVPFSRASVGFFGGGTSSTEKGRSTQAVTLMRGAVPVAAGAYTPAKVHWKVLTDRRGFSKSTIKFWYTDAEIEGLTQNRLDIFYTPETTPGVNTQWLSVNTIHDLNQKTITIQRDHASENDFNGTYALMQLDLRFELGTEIPLPFGVDLTQIPPFGPEVLGGGGTFWHNRERKLYATRPGAIEIKWSNAVTVQGICVWPEDPEAFQLHIAGTPAVDVSSEGAYQDAQLMFSEPGTGVDGSLVDTDLAFGALAAGRSLIMVANGTEPQGSDIFFLRVNTVEWNTEGVLFDGVPAEIGAIIEPGFDHDPACGGPFLLFDKALVNRHENYYDRETRTGPIIPVNLDSPNLTADDLVVVYYKKGARLFNPLEGAFLTTKNNWPVTPVRYNALWPANPPHVVIAKDHEDTDLNPNKFDNPSVYVQNEPTLPGFNPNEEHAFVAGGRLYALRDDLNEDTVSMPYVLVSYLDKTDGNLAKMQTFQVLREEPALGLTFDYAGTAGFVLGAPVPLQILNPGGLCGAETESSIPAYQPTDPDNPGEVDSPIFRDRQQVLWAYRAGDDGGAYPVSMFYYYPAQPDFYFPPSFYADGVPEAGNCVPWLDFADQTTDTPIETEYTINWPTDDQVAVMNIGRTLAQPVPGAKSSVWATNDATLKAQEVLLASYAEERAQKAGEAFLPQFDGQCSISVLYDQAEASGHGNSVKLFDYATPRLVPLEELPDDVVGKIAGTYTNLIDLPPHLFERLHYKQGSAELEFKGVYIDIPSGDDIVLPNVLTEIEYHTLLDFSADTAWQAAIGELWLNQNELIPVTDADTVPPLAIAMTSSVAERGGYVTIALGNSPTTCNSGPVQLQVIKVDCPLYVADVLPVFPNCVFDQQLTMRYGGDFAGSADDYIFEWKYLPDDGQDPRQVPIAQWLNFPLPAHPAGKEPGRGAVDITIKGPNAITLSDNFVAVRFTRSPEAKGTGPTGPCNPTSDWTFPQLAPGWIKRVVGAINPLTQRAEGGGIAGAEQKFFQYHEQEVNTIVSMLQQAGPRFEGAVGLNCDNLNDLKLIPTYETVLRMGRDLSIDSPNPYNFPPASNALLLVSGRIADLYSMLGNEAYADAADPTIGFGTGSGGDFAQNATALHCFMNQTSSLLEEELLLLRGRDETMLPGVDQAPVYNRLYPNFSSDFTGGQISYVLNYGITDVTGNGTADVNDALALFPQGHGDAWGHYLTATKAYYSLFAHPVYVYQPRAETVLIGAQPVSVDFFDERKFAAAAAAKARTGSEIVDLTYRSFYTEDPNGQYQGYTDTDPERAWGVSEWASRAGQGAYFDWVVANSLLPVENPQAPRDIRKIDRSTVTEIREIASSFQDIQAQVDKANQGVNPLGLAKNVVPFDIDPARIDAGEPHFEQIYNRAVKSMVNAITVFNHANESTQRLRLQQDDVQSFQTNVVNQEIDFNNRLIEIFGYPYAGDIGPGKTYPPGYDGPDLYHFDYFDPREVLGMDPGEIQQISFSLPALTRDSYVNPNGAVTGETSVVNFHVSEEGFGTVVPDPEAWGERRATGEIQISRQDLFHAIARYWQAIDNYSGLIQQVDDQVKLFEMTQGIKATEITIQSTQLGRKETLNDLLVRIEKKQFGFRLGAKVATRAADAVTEGIPKFIIAGLAVGFDATSIARGIIKGVAAVTEETLNGMADSAEIDKQEMQIAEEELQARESLQLAVAGQQAETINGIGALRNTLLNETTLRYEIYLSQQVMLQQMGRYKAAIARGQRELDKLLIFRRQTAANVEQYRYRDMAFRIFRNDALQKYRAQFDLAARYVYLAAQAYDYETNLLRSDTRSGQQFMNGIVKSRSLGLIQNGIPVTAGTSGDPGLADPMSRLIQNWEQVLKGQLGFNNPQTETNRFSLRTELFRIQPGRLGNDVWKETLDRHIIPNLLDMPEFQRYCRVFDNPQAVEPAIVIPMSTTVTFGQNFFGWPLGGGDSAYDSTNFATKVRSVGVWFSNYNNLGTGMSNTPRVFLVPVGSDIMRSPTEGANTIRHWKVIDQKLPVPFTLGATDFLNPSWIPKVDGLTDELSEIRKYSMFRAFHDSGNFNPAEVVTDSRLIGRSVANTEWLLIIPAGTLSSNRQEAIERFIHGRLQQNGERDGNGVSDIKLFFQTYAISGN